MVNYEPVNNYHLTVCPGQQPKYEKKIDEKTFPRGDNNFYPLRIQVYYLTAFFQVYFSLKISDH